MIENREHIPRSERYTTHICISIRKWKYIPLHSMSGVLLDISSAGFKIELVGKMNVTPGKSYWVHIPLNQLGIQDRSSLCIKGKCIWVDVNRHLFGGLFLDTNAEQVNIIENVIAALIDKDPTLIQT